MNKCDVVVKGVAIESWMLSVVIGLDHFGLGSGGDGVSNGVVVDVDCIASLEVHGAMSSSHDPVRADDGTSANSTLTSSWVMDEHKYTPWEFTYSGSGSTDDTSLSSFNSASASGLIWGSNCSWRTSGGSSCWCSRSC